MKSSESFWSTTKSLVDTSFEFWTLYFISWAGIVLGLLFGISPFVEIENRTSATDALFLYLVAALVFIMTRFWIHKKLVNHKKQLNVMSSNFAYFLTSLAFSGMLISFLSSTGFEQVKKITDIVSDGYSTMVVKFFVSSLIGIPIMVFLLQYLDKEKSYLRQRVLMIVITFWMGSFVYLLLSRLFGIDNIVETKLVGDLFLGSIPVWMIRLLVFGKN